jgi:hypothetical protein
MSLARRSRTALAVLTLPALASLAALLPCAAWASGEGGGGEAPAWHLEKVLPPRLAGESEEAHDSRLPVSLGHVGDIEFFAPNRGLLIAAGNGESVKPGVWAYNGREWYELAEVCGATDGRIAWSGPDEFWTVSDGRPGQTGNENHGPPPLADNTLCHFAAPHGTLEVVGSYASLAFQLDSYQAMHAAACLGPGDCWFGGDLLPTPEPGAKAQFGAFQLHWNGSALGAEPYPAEHPIEDLRRFGRYLYESVRIEQSNHLTEGESPSAPPDLHLITPLGAQPTFISLSPGLPQYASEELPAALDYLHLDADEEALWGAADPVQSRPEGSVPGEVTILRYAEGQWSQVIGYAPEGAANPFTKFRREETPAQQQEREKTESAAELTERHRQEAENETVSAIAPEPGSANAWLALTSRENELAAHSGAAAAIVARISATGALSERQTLPAAGEGGVKGAAAKITCPAANDCWLVTTEGWLFHLTTAAGRRAEAANPNADPAFATLIASRPADAGIPTVPPDAPPVDDSGLLGEAPALPAPIELPSSSTNEVKVPVPLLSNVRSRLVHGTTLELSFHLTVKARVRLLARRQRRVVASTPMRTLGAGAHRLLLRLQRRSWPTKLDLQTHALAPLPTTSSRGAGPNTVGTGLQALPQAPSFAEASRLP